MRRESDDGFVCGVCLETVYMGQCKCPEPEPDVQATIEALSQKLAENHELLRASRDTQAIAGSNANSRMLMAALKGRI